MSSNGVFVRFFPLDSSVPRASSRAVGGLWITVYGA